MQSGPHPLTTHQVEVGEIDKLFVYDEKEFAIIVKFRSSNHVYGLQHAEKTVQTRLIAQVATCYSKV